MAARRKTTADKQKDYKQQKTENNYDYHAS